VRQRADPAREDDLRTADRSGAKLFDQPCDALDVGALQGPVSRDVRISKCAGTVAQQALGELQYRLFALRRPTAHGDASIARIGAGCNPAREARAGLDGKRGVGYRGRAQVDALDAGAKPRFDRCHVTDAAAELNRQVDGADDGSHRLGVDLLTAARAVEVYDVQPWRAELLPAPRHRCGVVAVDGLARVVALKQAHAAPAA
jgi:hypothetical protein